MSATAARLTTPSATSLWAPLKARAFRALWLAVLVSNVGLWMQTVGAQWLLVSLPNADVLVALVQTADMLPDVLLGFIGGVLADTLDRRHILIAVQTFMAIAGAALTALTIVDSCRRRCCSPSRSCWALARCSPSLHTSR